MVKTNNIWTTTIKTQSSCKYLGTYKTTIQMQRGIYFVRILCVVASSVRAMTAVELRSNGPIRGGPIRPIRVE